MNSEDLKFKLLDMALEIACGSKSESNAPFIPFILSARGDGEVALNRFAADTFEGSLALAEEYLRTLEKSPKCAVLAYDGNVKEGGNKKEAILFKAYSQETDDCVLFARLYQSKSFMKKFKILGEPLALGLEENIMCKSV